MTHPTLTRAAIAITAIVLGARADAQDGADDDAVRTERARIEAAVTGVQQDELDRQLVQFVANALITGNENGVRDLGVAGVAPLKRLALEYDLGDLATYHWNPVVAIAWTTPDEAIATLDQALGRSTNRFSALCAIEHGLDGLAAIVSDQPAQVGSLLALVDRALGRDDLNATERETIALACVKHAIRSDAVDAVALVSPKLVPYCGEQGAALRFEKTGELDPRHAADVIRVLWRRDRPAAIALAGSDDATVRRTVASFLRPSSPEADDPATLALLGLLDDENAEVAAAAGEQFYALALERPNVFPRAVLEPRVSRLLDLAATQAELQGRTAFVQQNHYQLIWALDRAADDGTLVGLAVEDVIDRPDSFLQSNVKMALDDARVSEAGVLAAFQASQDEPNDAFQRPLYSRLNRVTDSESRTIIRRALMIAEKEHGQIWKFAQGKGALEAIDGELAARAVEVYAGQDEADETRELLSSARTWAECAPAMRAIASDASRSIGERYLAISCMLHSGSVAPEDAQLITEILLIDAEQNAPGSFVHRVGLYDSQLRFPEARHLLAEAIIQAWSSRLEEGEAFEGIPMKWTLDGAPDALIQRFLALANRAYESPVRSSFFESNGLVVVANCSGPDAPTNAAWRLVREAVAEKRGVPHAFQLALERGFETAALEGALRFFGDPTSYISESAGKDSIARVVGLKAFRSNPENATKLAEALATTGEVELMKAAKEALDEIAALKEVAARIADPTDAVAATPDLRETLFQWIAAGRADGADETAYKVGAIALQTLADLGDPRDRDYFRGLIESPIYGMDSERAGSMFRAYLTAWSKR